MQSDLCVFRYAIVEGGRAPGGGEKDEGDGLAKVVELQSAGSDAG